MTQTRPGPYTHPVRNRPLTRGNSAYTHSNTHRWSLVPLEAEGLRHSALVYRPEEYARLYALQYALGCDHYWVRIGPYLKCTRCGDLKAATTGRTG